MAVLLTSAARVVAIGATGAYGRAQVAYMRTLGTNVVAHVAAGRGGSSVDSVPVFDALADAVPATRADAAIVYTPALGVRDAIVECADAGIRLAVASAEYAPVHDTLYAVAYARERGLWLVGPNTVGMVTPGQACLGAIPPGYTRPGRIGVIGRSGTLTMTLCRLLSKAGLGQSTVVHVGGDTLAGRNPAEWLDLMIADHDTSVIVYAGEIGGTKEYAMLDSIRASATPVVSLIVGRSAPAGKTMGHAGALVGSAREGAAAKIDALRGAGAVIATSPLVLPGIVGDLLGTGVAACA